MTIGIAISGLLKANAALLALVNTDSIFPYVANPDTALPLIVYRINSLDAEYDKDGWVGDECTFSVECVSDDYSNLQLIATEIRAALELKKYTGTDRIEMTGMEEDAFQNGIFTNTLSFTYRIHDYSVVVPIPVISIVTAHYRTVEVGGSLVLQYSADGIVWNTVVTLFTP
jgi:hypothetical protein